MTMGNIRNKKLMLAKKETLVAKKKHVKKCALEAKEVVESLVENPLFLTKKFSTKHDLQLCCNLYF
jgi:hypothetical protein